MRSLECTLCSAELPVPEVVVPGGIVTLDETFVNEHIEMHTTCLCEWTGDTGHMVLGETDVNCPHHGLGDRRYSAVSDANLLGDDEVTD